MKVKDSEEVFARAEDIIERNELKKVSLNKLNEDYKEAPEVEKQRIESNKIMLEQIKNRVERRKYNELTKGMS